ncbi:hypothetical protein J7J35_00045, partial [Candidatus Bipolaricaulota bacterium]|nr:hypothetical protein [Candidatus Bipolaricaulota bacterium]
AGPPPPGRGRRGRDLHWIAGEPPGKRFECQVQIRYRAPAARAQVALEGDKARVEFQEPQRAVTPGQAAVFYRGEEVLGGGIIAQALSR